MTVRRPRFLPDPDLGERTFLGDLLRRETVGGGIALAAAALAVLWANSPWGASYDAFRHWQLGPLDMEHWAADGALTVFFFVAGLELKREFVVGSLRRPADAAVPVLAALCGVAVPALLYLTVNLSVGGGRPGGWAIPAATDIAFALAVLAVVGSNLPTALRAFLLTLAVVDDLVVIVIIAVFYTSTLDLPALGLAGLAFASWAVLQHRRVHSPLVYVPLAVAAWWCVHESGIHATIAGVVLGLLTRVRPDGSESRSPAERLEGLLSPVSSAVAVPFFALLSAGVVMSDGGRLLRDPVAVGVMLGLVVGKPVGVFGGTWLVTRFTRAELNDALAPRDLVGVAVLAGIGFTVSLLVSDLSFTGAELDAAKSAVLAGSVVSAVLGALLLRRR
jgi:NhaA family Na+:H+ antiporter